MSKELFNQPTITTEPSNDDRFAVSQPSIEGGKNWTWTNFKAWLHQWFDFTPQSTAPTYEEGRVFYDNSKKALSYFNDNSDVTVNLGQEVLFPVVNNSGATIPNGAVVTPDAIGIVLADRRYKDKSRLIAVATSEMLDGESGYVTRLGQVGGLDTSSYTAGQILYLGNNGTFATTPPDDGAYTVIVGVVDVVHASQGIITVDTHISDLTVEVNNQNGFPEDQREATTISFVEGTRTFTISPNESEYHFYELSDKYEKTSAENVVITDETGGHVIYFDEGVLMSLANASETIIEEIIKFKCIVAYIYWNSTDSTAPIVQDERHGLMPPDTHIYLHQRFGAFYLSGLALEDFVIGNGSSNTNAQFGNAVGLIKDEDISHTISAAASTTGLPYYYRLGAGGEFYKDTNAGYSFPVGASPRPQYNEWTGSTWQLTEIASGDYMNLHIFANGNIDGKAFVSLGIAEYSNVDAASAGQADELTTILGTLPLPEFVLIGSVIIEGKNNFTNDVQTRVVQNSEGQNYTNWTKTELSSGSAPTSHNNLAGLELAGTGVIWGHVSNNYPLQLPELDTTARDLIAANAGMKIYNTTDSEEQVYTGTEWVEVGSGGGGGSTTEIIQIPISDDFVNLTDTSTNALFTSQVGIFRLPYDCKITKVAVGIKKIDGGTVGNLNLKIKGQAGNVLSSNLSLDTATATDGSGGVSSTGVNTLYNEGTSETDVLFFVTAGTNTDAVGGVLFLTLETV